jgi:hypothetical protein
MSLCVLPRSSEGSLGIEAAEMQRVEFTLDATLYHSADGQRAGLLRAFRLTEAHERPSVRHFHNVLGRTAVL